jgi:glycerate 2-kinase
MVPARVHLRDCRVVKVVLAPDKFAGTLSGAEAAAAMAAGWSRARPGDEIVCLPMADGGEGTLEVVERAVHGCERVSVEVADARGIATQATWLLLPDGRGLVEAAEACGLSRLEVDQRNPRLATTYGVGQLVRSAADRGVPEIIVGLGGSATVDGGGGLATALGHRLLRADGNRVKVGGEYLRQIVRIEAAPPLGIPVVIAADVTNPLLGAHGAAAVYGPQKGAAAEDVPLLEECLRTLADVAERDLPGGPWRERPGAGAAGGLGFGLMAFCGARTVAGAALIGALIGLPAALEGADAVVAGEGSMDAQTASGKVAAHLAEAAEASQAAIYAIAGRFADGAQERFDAVAELGPQGLQRAAELVEQRAYELAERI